MIVPARFKNAQLRWLTVVKTTFQCGSRYGGISRINAGAAGVDKYIEFNKCSFEETTVPGNNKGIIYFNPEYGERMGEEEQLEETYAAIGDFLKKKCKGYMGYIFTGNLDLAKKIGLKPKRRIEFYTGKIDCRLLEYELYEGTKKTG